MAGDGKWLGVVEKWLGEREKWVEVGGRLTDVDERRLVWRKCMEEGRMDGRLSCGMEDLLRGLCDRDGGLWTMEV